MRMEKNVYLKILFICGVLTANSAIFPSPLHSDLILIDYNIMHTKELQVLTTNYTLTKFIDKNVGGNIPKSV